MTSLEPVLQARNTAAPTPLPAPAPKALSERLQEAEVFAKAGSSMLPAEYVNNVGACLLAVDFASKNGLDFLTTIQNVSFFRGKPMISSELWEARANQMGYSLKVEHSDERTCTVALFDGDVNDESAKVGTWTADVSKDVGPNKDMWRKFPRQMLYHNAVRNVCKIYAKGRGGLAMYAIEGADLLELEASEVDPVEVLAPQTEATNLLGEPDPANGFPEVFDEATLKAQIKESGRTQADVMRRFSVASLAELVADPETVHAVVAYLEGGD